MSFLSDLPDSTTFPASSATWPLTALYIALVCPRCGGNHRLEQYPDVRAIEYHPDGRTIRRVEFFDGTGARARATLAELAELIQEPAAD